jgi:hypothetical protein
LEAILLLYATGDVHHYWPMVKRFGLVVRPGPFADEALTDAIQRILCGRASIAQDLRAKSLRVRAVTYRLETKRFETLLRRWLTRAAMRFLAV